MVPSSHLEFVAVLHVSFSIFRLKVKDACDEAKNFIWEYLCFVFSMRYFSKVKDCIAEKG